MKARCGPLFVASPRFGLSQADKVRPIDDVSISLVHAAFASDFKLNLDGVGGIAVLARSFLESVKQDGSVEIVHTEETVGGKAASHFELE